jgi:hypothetical protein
VAPWLADSGLSVDQSGFVRVSSTLQSISHPVVFATGDVASMDESPRPKAGVLAVRQGRLLDRNLRRALLGQPLAPYRLQRQFLSLISTGDKHAVASLGPLALRGGWVWRWKDWIDSRFMRRYQELPEMPVPIPPAWPRGLADAEALAALSASALRCGGCGAKVGAAVLSRALQRVAEGDQRDVLNGLDAPDDAAVVDMPGPQVCDSHRRFLPGDGSTIRTCSVGSRPPTPGRHVGDGQRPAHGAGDRDRSARAGPQGRRHAHAPDGWRGGRFSQRGGLAGGWAQQRGLARGRWVAAARASLDGAETTACAGMLSSLQPKNARARLAIVNPPEGADGPRFALLFDPQTAEGLLAGAPAERAQLIVCEQARRARLRDECRRGCRHATPRTAGDDHAVQVMARPASCRAGWRQVFGLSTT